MAGEEKKLSLKIYVNSNTRKVIFAEVGKDFVDLLYGILSLPLATVMKILDDSSLLGGIGNFYESNQVLDASYLQNRLNKDTLLTYIPPINLKHLALLLPNPEVYFRSVNAYCYNEGNCGFVKEMVTFMATDDLKVTPLSMKSVAVLLAEFNLQRLDSLEEKTVAFGLNEAKKMLKASLIPDAAVLTSVFLCGEDDDTTDVKSDWI